MAYETPLAIADVMKDISNNKYVLPSIQREFVWDPDQIATLFDSLMQEYPIGTFLFWEISKEHVQDYDFYEFLRNYHEKNTRHNNKIDLKGSDGVTAVLDGQQRLTSLYIGLKGTYAYRLKYRWWNNDNAYPVRKLYLNLVEPPKEGNNKYDFRFLPIDSVKNSENEVWFEVGKILDMPDTADVSMYAINHVMRDPEYQHTKEQEDFAFRTLNQLNKVIHTSLTISYYREKSTELDKVLNIFIRVNSGGTTLTYSDLLLSIASAQWEHHDAREEITSFVDELNSIGDGFRFNKDFVLKTALVLTDIPNIAFKVDNFNKKNMMLIESKWDDIKKAIRQAVLLVSSFGYSGETLNSTNAVIPIAYYLLQRGVPANYIESGSYREDRMTIKKWLIYVLLKRQFSGTSDNVIRQCREVLQKNNGKGFPFEGMVERFKGSSKSIQFTEEDIDDYLLKQTYGKNDTLSTLMLLYPSLDYKNKFHEDHMYPKSKFNKAYLRQQGVPEDKLDEYISRVNEIANLQLLPAQLNEEKLNTDFDKWFSENYKNESERMQYRTMNYLPDMDYSYTNFLHFLDTRKKLFREKLAEILL